MQDVHHLLNRIGFGPRPGDIDRVRTTGVEKYLDQQLDPDRIADSAVEERLASLSTIHMSTADLMARYQRPGPARILQARPMAENVPQQILLELQAQKLIRAVHSQRQLREVMTDFWFNHFNVFWGKNADRWLTTNYEMHAIRPHVLGKFKDLLMATAKSPAMLFYLDNHLSSSIKGINENYGRELMELHTLGVDGGYTQKDVQEVARAFTGWSIERPQIKGEFIFRPRLHDGGEKLVLGHKINSGGIRDGEAVIDILAKHPSTARFISTKLVRRFVSDDPPANLVRHVAEVYRKTDGDIGEMMRSILTSKEFDSREAAGAKTKTPFEYVTSAIRSLDGSVAGSAGTRQLAQSIARMGQPLYQCQPPAGYPDQGEHWMSNGAILERLNFAVSLANNQIPGCEVRLDAPVKSVIASIGGPEFQKR
jgi:uncharacterized protein (DUF1800 family)